MHPLAPVGLSGPVTQAILAGRSVLEIQASQDYRESPADPWAPAILANLVDRSHQERPLGRQARSGQESQANPEAQ